MIQRTVPEDVSMNKKIADFNLKKNVQMSFPILTRERLDKLREIHAAKGQNYIDKQLLAKEQLKKKIIPAPQVVSKFKQPVLFKRSKNLAFKPITAGALKVKINRNQIIQPIGKVEIFHKEIQDLSKVESEKELIPCPLCCRAFLSKESACKHVIICHENYGEGIEKQKFLSNLKSAVDVRVTNLSQLLLNELTEAEVVEKANEIVKRTPTFPENEIKISEIEQVEADHHVSNEELRRIAFCSS